MRKSIALAAVISALLPFGAASSARDGSGEPDQGVICIMKLLGVDTPEDLAEDEVESLSVWLESPLEINTASRSRILSSGLFTPYLAASLMDYRNRHGDVLSLAELAAVDGFSEDFAFALAPFISLRSNVPAGKTAGKAAGVKNLMTARGAVRRVGSDLEYSYGAKYRLEINDRFQFGLSANRTYGGEGAKPDGGSFFLAYYGEGNLGKIVVGDYRLRFGQGLTLWSGFRMDSFSSPEAYCMRSYGVSPYWSFSGDGSYRGMAADFNIGRFSLSASVAVNGLRELMAGDSEADLSLMPAVNAAWCGRKVRVGVTAYCTTAKLNGEGDDSLQGWWSWDSEDGFWSRPVSSAGCSADFRWCPGGTDVFGEVAADLTTFSPSALLGTILRVSDSVRIALKALYTEDEYRLDACGSFSAGRSVGLAGKSGFGSSARRHSGSMGVEASCFPGTKYGAEGPNYQVKAVLNYSLQLNSYVALALRYALRLRSAGEKCRNDLRCDLKFSSGRWSSSFRINALYNTDLSVLSYIEGGWNSGAVSMFLRAGAFRIDNWADRIYVYERDAPGNFNVPAYYGRGYWGAFTAGVKVVRQFKAYVRLSTLQYPWISPTASARTPKSEAKLMLVIDL